MVRPIIATSSVNPNPSMEEPCVMMEHVEPYVHNVRQTHDQRRIVCPTDHERHLLNQDLEMFWAHHNSIAKACEIFIEEVTLRAWRQTQSCSRNTIQSCDIKNALKNSVIYDELNDLVSFEQHSVIHQEVPHDVVHQQVFTSANVNVPAMKDPIDIDQIQQKCLYGLTTEHFIDIGEFVLDPKYK
ncbi:Histone-fold [Arabidopsis suecica]|uniref:Histone-fold n=1 Tax=Arabidopsis suecica TaxID=45249 RepID=A0A8T2DFR7_ARASU|nr:Histone-fold [Arabidopsis suecica]